jgi:hypothetical protein
LIAHAAARWVTFQLVQLFIVLFVAVFERLAASAALPPVE